MKLLSTILFYLGIINLIMILVIAVNVLLDKHFLAAFLLALVFIAQLIVLACPEAYEAPRQQMFKFIDRWLK